MSGNHYKNIGRGGGGGGGHDRGPYRSNFNSNNNRHGGGHRFHGSGGGGRYPHRSRSAGNQSPGNRFTAQARANPEDGVWRNLLNMLTVVGEQSRENRADNLKLLVNVITGSNASLFLAYDPTNEISAKDHYGPMVIHLIHCVTALPQHTAVYAVLAHLIHAKTANSPTGGPNVSFAQRCMGYSVRFFGRDLDMALSSQPAEDRLLSERRCHIMVRFWAKWWINMPGSSITLDDASSRIVPLAIQKAPLETFPQLLQTLVTAAQLSRKHHKLFASLALTGANALDVSYEDTNAWVQQFVCRPIEEVLAANAAVDTTTETGDSMSGSDFAPGIGKYAILLLYEQWESDDTEEDEREEEYKNSGSFCDSLQDLLRISKLPYNDTCASLHISHDAPWKEFDEQDLPPSTEIVSLDLFDHSDALLNILRNRETASGASIRKPAECPSIVPRLPIFGSPSSKHDADNEGEEEEEEEDHTSLNPRLKEYKDNFSLLDRFYYGQMIRDIALLYEPTVTDAGLELGSVKVVAEKLWLLQSSAPPGMEYCILEALLPLMLTPYTSVPLISKVILELTKLEPAYFSAAVALAVYTLVEDYMPNLAPVSRSTLASWFAFHLIHTDYQWPVAYWQHWEQDKDIWNSASRKSFIKETLAKLVANTFSPKVIQVCLPEHSLWVNELLVPIPQSLTETTTMVTELQHRFSNLESADNVLKYLSEISEANTLEKIRSVVAALCQPVTDEHRRQLASLGEDTPQELGHSATDVYPFLVEQLKRYLVPLVSGIVVDSGLDMVKVVGGIVLEEILTSVCWSEALEKRCIQLLLETKLCEAKDIISWNLKQCDSTSIGNWWENVGFVIHVVLRQNIEVTSTSSDHSISTESNMSTAVNTFLEETLRYLVTSVVQLVVSNERQAVGHRLPVNHVSMVEGLKSVVCQTEAMYSRMFSTEAWVESNFNGPQIAQSIEVGGLPAIDLLQLSLKNM